MLRAGRMASIQTERGLTEPYMHTAFNNSLLVASTTSCSLHQCNGRQSNPAHLTQAQTKYEYSKTSKHKLQTPEPTCSKGMFEVENLKYNMYAAYMCRRYGPKHGHSLPSSTGMFLGYLSNPYIDVRSGWARSA